MEKVRIGVIGVGNMGYWHIQYLHKNEIENAELAAVCDINPQKLEAARNITRADLPCFESAEELMKSGLCDAIIIAVPHYLHPPMAIAAFEHGLHVLTEKPAGVYTKQVREMNEAAERSGKVFGIMYNQRTTPVYQKMREMIQNGELGAIKRTNWIITNWYRTQAYYNSGSWRASWAGEGGGVLLNQCPHNLDLWQWIAGTPKRVFAKCDFGKYHDIEVEDDVTAIVEYENGATGVFVTTTGDAPGTNRFEISGEMGKLICEGGKLVFYKNEMNEREFNATTTNGFSAPKTTRIEIDVESGNGPQHAGITQDFVNAILSGSPLLAPGIEGIRGLSISNAMLLSTWTGDWVDIPVDEEKYLSELEKRIATSRYKPEQAPVGTKFSGVDMSKHFGKF
ncbi:MAG: Gfo/Idh/MocA family oxidoreductase [Ruminococcaceae bacterium]|nr:Gfo/Idh/MocA family oxidoreductase [Oscillospiraceae bacterium]